MQVTLGGRTGSQMGQARTGEVRNTYNILVWIPEGKRPLRKPRHRWEDNIKMDVMKIGFGSVEWICLPWRTLVMNLWVL
jgi:hypothetical protein